MQKRFWIYLIIFFLINFSFVPLMSWYGLRVCPVLNVAGFWFGCAYTGTYILIVNLLNTAMLLATNRLSRFTFFVRYQVWLTGLVYLVATAGALITLEILLNENALTGSSRAPEILTFASLMLGMTQFYGLMWVRHRSTLPVSAEPKTLSFNQLWFRHSARTLVPILTVLALLIHFQVSQHVGFNKGRTASLVGHDEMIAQTSTVIFFIMIWLFITLGFHFLSERDYALNLQIHLVKISDHDSKYRSPTAGAWGLWFMMLDSLNQLSKTLGERARLLGNFSRFVSEGVAKQALKADLKKPIGMTQDMTVMFTDIRNFTGISEKLDPDQTVDFLNQYFSAMIDVLIRHQITVDKFIGDGILAYVEPLERKENNEDQENQWACEAALEMLERLQSLNPALQKLGFPEIRIGIGIFRGPVIVGLIGSESKLQHTIIGDAVNRSSRLEGLCRDLGVQILLSESVWKSLSELRKSQFRPMGDHNVKGMDRAIAVYGFR